MGHAARLLLGAGCVLFSSWLFTNALEWLGMRLRLPHGALGSVFAATGTALPEASIAVLAALLPTGGGATAGTGSAVSIGAVLGAPLLLATLGFGVLGLGAVLARRRELQVAPRAVRRDLVFFLCAFGAAAVLGFADAPRWVRAPAAGLLLAGYALYVVASLTGTPAAAPSGTPRPLVQALGRPWGRHPPTAAVALQLGVAVALMLLGAELFVHTLSAAAAAVRLPSFLLTALVAPLATELPETVNSLVWIRRGKDALATGNVTGALALQGSVIPALGLLFTPWRFTLAEAATAAAAFAGAAAVLAALRWEGRLRPGVLLAVGGLYIAFVVWVV